MPVRTSRSPGGNPFAHEVDADFADQFGGGRREDECGKEGDERFVRASFRADAGEIDVRLQFVFEHRGLFQVLFVHALRFGVQSVVKEFVRVVKLLARGQFFPPESSLR